MSNPVSKLNRRQFLRLSAAGGSALLLAACGANGPAEETAVDSTLSMPAPVATDPPAAPPAAAEGVEVMVRDVLDYVLDSDEWPGDFGSVTFRLHAGRVNGQPIYYIRTDASDAAYAEAEGLVYVPLLNTAAGQDIANKLYLLSDGQPPVMSFGPADEQFASLFQIVDVTVNEDGLTLDSADGIEAAAADGSLTLDERPLFVNHPIIKWPEGELAVDDAFEAALGNGQLFAPCDTENMEVTMKLHQCYPGSRYIVTDTSMAPMAPMMSINAAPPTQRLKELGGTDEIWVFANGIPGSGVMGFQPAVFDNKAGQPAWSPFWDHFTVRWVDESQARVLETGGEIRELIASGDLELFNGVPDSHPTGFIVNCPAPLLAPNDFSA